VALTLAAGISASARYCTVNQPPTQPPGSYYRIGDEVVQHIGYVTTTPIWTPNFTQLYIARGQLGTTAASHLSAAALTYVRPEFLSATADTDPGPFETGGGGGGGRDVLTDPGNDWAPSTVVTVGYRIAETVNGALRVFETTTSGTTHATASGFTDFSVNLAPLGLTTEFVTWRYLGIVGELPWDIVPLPGIGLDDQGFHVDALSSISDAETMFQLLPALGDPGNAWQALTLISTANYRIAATVSGALRVFEMVTLGTTGGSEPTWPSLARSSMSSTTRSPSSSTACLLSIRASRHNSGTTLVTWRYQRALEMPFKSKKQAAFMFANHPRIAARFVRESGKKHPIKGLPTKVKKSKRKS
jgi:hypothetical protein